MTEAERKATPCPKCHQKAGDPCIDPLGDPTPRCHKVRGPGQYEQHLAERIGRQTARQKASYGPLFQELAEAEVVVPTVAEVKHQARFAAALSFDEIGPVGMALCEQANKGMEWIYIHWLGRELERRIGDVGRAFAEHSVNTYPLSYQRMMFKEFMTTTKRRQVGPYRTEANNSLGFTVAYRHTWEPAAPLMTVEEFDRLYPESDHFRGVGKDAPDDPTELFAGTVGVLTAG